MTNSTTIRTIHMVVLMTLLHRWAVAEQVRDRAFGRAEHGLAPAARRAPAGRPAARCSGRWPGARPRTAACRVRAARHGDGVGWTTISTRRLSARPSGEALSATG